MKAKHAFFVILLFLNSDNGSCLLRAAAEEKISTAESYFKTAQQLFNEHKYDLAEIELKKALDLNIAYAEAYSLLANIYLKKGTIQDRTEAEKLINQAIKLMPYNVNYHLTLVEIYKEQGFTEKAQYYLEYLCEEFPENLEIKYLLGNIYQRRAENLQNMVTREGGEVLHFDKFYKNEFKKALNMYQELKQLNPHYSELDRRLAMIAYKENDFNKMILYAKEFVQNQPCNRNSHLVLGLAYLRSGEYVKANESFSKFREKLLPIEKEYFENFDQFLSEEQQTAIANMITQDRSNFHNEFWLSRDPLFLTDYNEREIEHYGRVAEAYLLFSEPKVNLEGWKSDRGIIWVRYGPPNYRIKYFDPTLRALDNIEHFLNEFWYYDNFMFRFFEYPLWTNNVYFWYEGNFSYKEVARQLQKKLPDLFKMKIHGKHIDFPRYAVDFRGKKNKSRIELFFGIPMSALYYAKKYDEYVANVDQGIFLFDNYWNQVIRNVHKESHVSPVKVDTTSTKILTFRSRMDVKPGDYTLAIEFKDDSSGNIGAIRDQLIVESYGYDSLQISDLLLASNIELKPTAELINIDNLNYTPSIGRSFKKPQTIFLYFEIYNLQITGVPGESKYQLEYGIQYKKSPTDKEWSIGKALGRLFSFSKNKFELATTAEYTGSNPVENMYIEIDPSSLNPGMYQLTLKVTDQLAKQTAEKRTIFYLKE